MSIEKILNKRSNAVVTEEGVDTPKKPTSSQLDNGEIAVNYHKGTERMFMKNDNDEVVEFVPKNEVENHFAKMMPYGRNSGTLAMGSSYEETVIGANSIEFYEDTNTEGTLAGSLRGYNSHLEVKHGNTDDPHQWKRIATIDDIPSVTPQVQSNWNETDTTSKAYILNKPTIPTKTSDLTNDSGFLTAHQDISGKANKIIVPGDVHILPKVANDTSVIVSSGPWFKKDGEWYLYNKHNGIYFTTNYEGTLEFTMRAKDNNNIAGRVYINDILYYEQLISDIVCTTSIPVSVNDSIRLDIVNGSAAMREWYIESLSITEPSSTKDLSDVEEEIPTKTSDLTNDSGFVDTSVNNLTNYYLKTDTYTKTEVDNKIGDIETLLATI